MNDLLSVIRSFPSPIRWVGIFLMFATFGVILAKYAHFSIPLTILAVAVIVGALWIFDLLVKRREKAKAKSFEGNLGVNARAGAGREEVREALRELSDKWGEAVKRLRESGLSIYSLPWYLLIGEPQSGKSTTLKNSGLEFPVGADGLSGAGGTRNCDWWFSNEAVILDTAGRFTFQEENAPDQDEWATFLKLLRKHRRDCPVNGTIVVIPATSLVEDSADEQERKAKNIREKLLTLQRTLDVRFPVFILVTKCDRILGFSELWTRLDPTEQRQLLGWSNPAPPEEPFPLDRFPAVFDDLVRRVHKVRLRFLRDETNTQQIDRFFVFPEELGDLAEPLGLYIRTIFAASRYEEPFMLRGFYLTSGVQQGRPIARACRDLLRVRVGDPHGVLENLEQVFQKSRAFFIRDFYEKKLFPEKGLVARTRAALERDKIHRWVLWGLSATVVLVLIPLLVWAGLRLHALRPPQALMARAEKCIDKPCSLEETSALLDDLDAKRAEIHRHRKLMWILLKSSRSNELETGLASIEAKLFQDLLRPLYDEFEARSAALDWQKVEKRETYDRFLKAFRNDLSIGAFSATWRGQDPDREKKLAEIAKSTCPAGEVGAVGSVVELLGEIHPATPGDESAKIDEWIGSEARKRVDLDRILSELTAVPGLGTSPLDVARGKPDRPRQAFDRFWTVGNLARWQNRWIEHLDRWKKDYDALLALDLSAAEPEPVLAGLVTLGADFVRNHEEGGRHMADPKGPFPGFGSGPDEWKAKCAEDWTSLAGRSAQLLPATSPDVCGKNIQTDWEKLDAARTAYAYLYVPKAEEKGKPRAYEWTPAASKIATDVVAKLAPLADLPPLRDKDTKEFEPKLAAAPVDKRAELFAAWVTELSSPLTAASDAARLLDLPATAPELRGGNLSRWTSRASSLALLLRAGPVVERHFRKVLETDCASSENCFTRTYAGNHIRPAAQFLSTLVGARQSAANPAAARPIDAVEQLLTSFLERWIDQISFGGGGGGGGGGVRVPSSARNARNWGEFVNIIARQWNPIDAGGGGAPVPVAGAESITPDDIESWAGSLPAKNALKTKLSGKQKSAATKASRPKKVDPAEGELRSAAPAWQTCVSSLDGKNPLKSWTTLARGENPEVGLATFHVFTKNPRIGKSPIGQAFQAIEKKGSELLAAGIREAFAARMRGLLAQARGIGRYPFVTSSDFSAKKGAFDRGYAPSTPPWLAEDRRTDIQELRWAMQLDTASVEQLEAILPGSQGYAGLNQEFALGPIVDGSETLVDFVSPWKEQVRCFALWSAFLFDEKGRRTPLIQARIVPRMSSPGRPDFGQRFTTLRLFGAELRPSTDPSVRREPTPLRWQLSPAEPNQTFQAKKEESGSGAGRRIGTIDLRGGPLKILYFLALSRDPSLRPPGTNPATWYGRIPVPVIDEREAAAEAVLEVSSDRPLPGVFVGFD
jgi:hypothetical protein